VIGMDELAQVAPAFVEMAHRIVWATAATVDERNRPWTRVLHPIWQFDGERLVGWIGTSPTPTKRAHLSANPYLSLTYWHPNQDTANAHCRAELLDDDDTRVWLWENFASAPEPVGYDPAIIQPWSGGPTSPAFVALRLEPWRLRVQPGALMAGDSTAKILHWRERD